MKSLGDTTLVDMSSDDVDAIFEIARIALDYYLYNSPHFGKEINNLDLSDNYLADLLAAIKARQ